MSATGRPASAAIRLTSGLVNSPSGKRIRASDAGDKRREHVGLILGGIGRDAQQRPIWMIGLGDPRVMAGREPGAAEAHGQVEHRVEPDVAVAADARVRRLPGREAGDERLDHAGPELRAQIDREVGQPHRVRERPRLRDRGG